MSDNTWYSAGPERKSKPLFALQYIALDIRLRCCEPACLPPYLGSMLHGVIGWALQSNKELYEYLYENGRHKQEGLDIVNPYLLDPPRTRTIYRTGDILGFQLTLLGTATHYANELVRTLVETDNFGLGADRRKFELDEIRCENCSPAVWTRGLNSLIIPQPQLLFPQDSVTCERCAVLLQTPLRIRRKGMLLTEIDFPVIIRNITGRIRSITERYGGTYDADAAETVCELSTHIQTASNGLSIRELNRYSSRRNKKMDWCGLMGAMTFKGDLTGFTPWLEASRLLHIGRNVTFGFGKIDVMYW